MSTYTGTCTCGDFSFHTGSRYEANRMKNLHESKNAAIQRDAFEDFHRVELNARVERNPNADLGVYA